MLGRGSGGTEPPDLSHAGANEQVIQTVRLAYDRHVPPGSCHADKRRALGALYRFDAPVGFHKSPRRDGDGVTVPIDCSLGCERDWRHDSSFSFKGVKGTA